MEIPANPIEKEGYILEFSDEFVTKHLDTEKWLPHYLPQWSHPEASKAYYALKNNQLHLNITKNQQPWSSKYTGNLRVSSLQTGCRSGVVGSSVGQHPFRDDLIVKESQHPRKYYLPQYGYFEVRLKAVALAGYMCAFWMIGFEDKPKHSAEICICELRGEHISSENCINGYGLHPFKDTNITDEFYEDRFDIDATHFHIYAADWTPTHIDFYIDNKKVRTINQSPNYPMQFMLNIFELPDALSSESKNASFPKTMVVDYVRGYKKISYNKDKL